jgi:outer membrane murein-binding lipoprotein Lpp
MLEGNPVTLDTLHGDLADLNGEVGNLRGEVGALRGDVGALRGDVGALSSEVGELRGEIRAGFADLKTTMITGFAGMPTRESSEEMVRLLREGNRLQEVRLAHLDVALRDQHAETRQVLHAIAESHQLFAEEQRQLSSEVRGVSTDIRGLSADIKALIVRIDALIRGRNDGEPA